MRIKEPLQQQSLPNQSYSMDFMSDALTSGRRLRILKVMDDCTRESLAVWCDYSITAEKVTQILQEVIRERKAKPLQVRVYILIMLTHHSGMLTHLRSRQ